MMKSTLFPYYYRYIGWPLLIAGLILGFLVVFFELSIPWLDFTVVGFGEVVELVSDQNDDSISN